MIRVILLKLQKKVQLCDLDEWLVFYFADISILAVGDTKPSYKVI